MLNNYRNETIVIFSQLQTNGTCTLKCENGPICEMVAKCETKSTLNVKIDAIEPLTHLATFSHIATFSHLRVPHTCSMSNLFNMAALGCVSNVANSYIAIILHTSVLLGSSEVPLSLNRQLYVNMGMIRGGQLWILMLPCVWALHLEGFNVNHRVWVR